jgi:hypothetical protein
VVGIARRLKMHVQFRASDGDGLSWHAHILAGDLLEAVENILRGEIALLHPAFFIARVANPDEAAVLGSLQYVHSLAVADSAGLVVNRGHTVAQRSLGDGDIGRLARLGFIGATSCNREQEQPSDLL